MLYYHNIFYGYKELTKIFPDLIFWQFIIQPLILFVFINYAMKSAYYISSILIPNKLKIILSTISNLTLDIYVVQIPIINIIRKIDIQWIYKVIISIIIILIVAYFCNKIANTTANFLKNIITRRSIQ